MIPQLRTLGLSPTIGQPDKSIEPKATPTMNTIHIRILRRTHGQNDWAPLDDNDNEIQEVPVRDDETPETTNCVEFLRDTLEKYRIHPGDAVMVQRMNADEITEYVPTIRYTRTLDWWHGRQVIEAADDLGRQYVGTRGADEQRDRYLLVRTTAQRIADFYSGEAYLSTILTEGPADTRYMIIGVPTETGEILTVVRFDEDIQKSGFLPAPGGTIPKK